MRSRGGLENNFGFYCCYICRHRFVESSVQPGRTISLFCFGFFSPLFCFDITRLVGCKKKESH